MKEHSNLRRLPQLTHEGRTVIADGRHMLNLSSNDYLGLAADRQLKEEFLQTLTPDTFLPTSSSSRLLTGNFGIYEELETELATLFGTETALVLNSGYHANMGILAVWKVIPLMAGSLLLSAFFCLFHLFMYYITQPYTEEKTVKSPIFSVVNALVYFGCYLCLQIQTGSWLFTLGVLAVTIIFIPLSYFCVFRFAPKTFKIR